MAAKSLQDCAPLELGHFYPHRSARSESRAFKYVLSLELARICIPVPAGSLPLPYIGTHMAKIRVVMAVVVATPILLLMSIQI